MSDAAWRATWLGRALALASCAPPPPRVSSDRGDVAAHRAPAGAASDAPAGAASEAPAPLRVHEVVSEPGAPAQLLVVLLHGFGAPGDDLVPFAESLRVPAGTVFLVPEGRLEVGPGRRAWWTMRLSELRALPEAERTARLETLAPEGLEASRGAVEAVIAEATARFGLPASQVVVGGFSQGAMLATDVVLHHPEPVGGLVILSGSPLDLRAWRARMPSRASVPVFLAHGRADSMLPFGGAEALASELRAAGFPTETVYFDGGHAIPGEVERALGGFLTRRASPSAR